MTKRIFPLQALICAMAMLARAQTSQPILIEATDIAAITAAIGKDVIVQGVVLSAKWNPAGSVMNIEFKGGEQSRLTAVVFQKQRAAFDAAFMGDVCKTVTGAKVRIKGPLSMYVPQGGTSTGRPEIVMDRPDQITIMEPAK